MSLSSSVGYDRPSAIAPGTGEGQMIMFGNASVQSAVIQGNRVRVVSPDIACFLAFGAAPTATQDQNSLWLAAAEADYFMVVPGQLIAVIADFTPLGTPYRLMITVVP